MKARNSAGAKMKALESENAQLKADLAAAQARIDSLTAKHCQGEQKDVQKRPLPTFTEMVSSLPPEKGSP